MKKKKKKRFSKQGAVLILLLLFGFSFFSAGQAYADSSSELENQLNEQIEDQLDHIDTSELDELFQSLSQGELFGGTFTDRVKSILSGEFAVNSASFLEAVFRLFLQEFTSILPLLSMVAVVCILCGIIAQLKNPAFKSSTSEIISFVCYGVVIVLVLAGVMSLTESAKSTISVMQKIMNLCLPVLLTLMAALGGTVSVKAYQPAIAFLSGSVVQIVVNLVLPIFLVTVVFTVISNLSKNVRLEKLNDFCKSSSNVIIGITFTVFTAFLAVQGLTAATHDGVSIRAAKFATKNYIPILGGYLADGFDLILASSVLIKNAFGVAGLVLLILAVAMPVIQILVFSLGLKFVAALVEPITDSRITKFINATAKNLNVLTACIVAVAFMFFLTVMLLIFTSNAFY